MEDRRRREASDPDDVEKRRLIRQQLRLLLHSYKCRKRNDTNCGFPHCPLMKDVLEHLPTCRLDKNCPNPHCSSSRLIIVHWRACSKIRCLICSCFIGHPDAIEDSLNPTTQIDLSPTMTTTTVEPTQHQVISPSEPTYRQVIKINLNPDAAESTHHHQVIILREITDARTCIICTENEISHAIVPCGHTVCESCGEALWKAGQTCYICRGPFENLFRIYLP